MSLSLLSNVLVGIPKSKEKRSLLKQSNQNFLKLRFRADYCEVFHHIEFNKYDAVNIHNFLPRSTFYRKDYISQVG